jgi:hypothetical protein
MKIRENDAFLLEFEQIDPAGVIFGPAKLRMKPKSPEKTRRRASEAIRCPCAVCAQLDRLPEARQGWPGAFQLAMPWPAFDHTWYWRKILPDRHGQACRVVAHGKKNSVLVEFEDGFRAVTSRYAVRKRLVLSDQAAS